MPNNNLDGILRRGARRQTLFCLSHRFAVSSAGAPGFFLWVVLPDYRCRIPGNYRVIGDTSHYHGICGDHTIPAYSQLPSRTYDAGPMSDPGPLTNADSAAFRHTLINNRDVDVFVRVIM